MSSAFYRLEAWLKEDRETNYAEIMVGETQAWRVRLCEISTHYECGYRVIVTVEDENLDKAVDAAVAATKPARVQ